LGKPEEKAASGKVESGGRIRLKYYNRKAV
jgi:hypothetical protein